MPGCRQGAGVSSSIEEVETKGGKGLSGMGLHLVHEVTEPLWNILLLDLCHVHAVSPEPGAVQGQIRHCGVG